MKPLSRRSVTTGLAAALTAIVPAGAAFAKKSNARERVEYHARELEKAMAELYGVEVTAVSFEPTATMRPVIMVVAQTV